ncbi:MAG: S-adenosylmethionine:tRNA ribosyltransferase-isomerase [Chloroflexota bacterium]
MIGLPVPVKLSSLDFTLPAELEAAGPPETRGLARDEVRLLVSHRRDDRIQHCAFRDLPRLLDPGDVLVINTSGTLNASLPVTLDDGRRLELHLSTHLPGDVWSAGLRRRHEDGAERFQEDVSGERLSLPGGASARIHTPYRCNCLDPGDPHRTRLWLISLELPQPWRGYLEHYGSPIRYGYVSRQWPGSYYQTVYTTEPGSAEMPSAGRPVSVDLLARLADRGIRLAPLLLHTGVASPEEHEPPYEEYYRVPEASARLINAAHASGNTVIAVGTTVVRALETVTGPDGVTHPGEGWTCTVITPERGVHSVDGLLTGLHEPRSSHLAMLQAIAQRESLVAAYDAALKGRYLWHEFGDVHLILD